MARAWARCRHFSFLVVEGHLEVLGAGLDVPDLEDALGVDGEKVGAKGEHEVDGGGVPAVHALQLVTAAPGVHLMDHERMA